MKKIILTIIILAVAKSIFAAPSTYLDATRMQTVPFPITPSLTIKARMDALDAADRSATLTALAAQAIADLESTGTIALERVKAINALILDKGSCLYTDTVCTQENVDYIAAKVYGWDDLPGTVGVHHWLVPEYVTSVEARLTDAGKSIRTTYFNDTSRLANGNIKTFIVPINGRKKIWYRLGGDEGDNFSHGRIEIRYTVERHRR